MCHLWMIKHSDINMDVSVSSMDDQVLCHQYGCQSIIYGLSSTLLSVWMPIYHLWIIKYSAISMDVNVSSMEDQVLCFQYECQYVMH